MKKLALFVCALAVFGVGFVSTASAIESGEERVITQHGHHGGGWGRRGGGRGHGGGWGPGGCYGW